MDSKMDSSTTLFENIDMSPRTDSFAFSTFDPETYTAESSFAAGSISGGASPNGYVSYGMPYSAADQYPSPSGESVSSTPDMMGMPLQQFESSPILQAQPPSHARNNQGSFSSVASSATAVSYSGVDVEIKEEMSPVSIVSPAAEIPSVDADVNGAAPAPTASPNTAAGTTATTPTKAPAKRKRENRYKNAPPAVLSRRRAQNRASQRAYRERKDQRIRDLEKQLFNAQKEVESCKMQMGSMHSHMMAVRMQLAQSTGLPIGPAPTVSFMSGPPAMPMAPMPPTPNSVPMMQNGQQLDASMFHQPPPSSFNIAPPPPGQGGFPPM
ncbi:hypothetical protein SEUCBS139899_000263 [Sporothrix eucalyptigena]